MKIAVIGSQGFIGSHVYNSLKNSGHNVESIQNLAIGDISSDLDANSLDWILNFAGKTSLSESFKEPIGIYRKNIDIALAAIQMSYISGATLLNVSSYVYGDVKFPPAKESDKLTSSNPYMGSKIAIETILADLASQLDVGLVTIRPSNIYGFGQRQGMLLSSLIKSANDSHEVIVNDPEPKRDYLYIEDFCSLIKSMIENKKKLIGETFNVGSGEVYSNYEVANIVRQQFSIEAPVKSLDTRRKNDVLDGSIDVSKIKQFLDWEPKYNLVQGVKDSVEREFGL